MYTVTDVLGPDLLDVVPAIATRARSGPGRNGKRDNVWYIIYI